MNISQTDLILNPDGSVYHLALTPDEIAHQIIAVGDPDRVGMVSKYFDKIEVRKQKREFVTHTGTIGKKRFTVISTGIGTDNIDIVLNELDALVNVDLVERNIKTTKTSLDIIRIGTSGALRESVGVDVFLASSFGLGLDTLGEYYEFEADEEAQIFIQNVKKELNLKFSPYFTSGSDKLLALFPEIQQGITASCPGFYAPQGRVVRAKLKNPSFIDNLSNLSFKDSLITNFEMETSAYYTLGKVLGHHCLSLNAIVANRASKKFSTQPYETVDKLIQLVLEKWAV